MLICAQDLCAVAPPPTQPLGKLDGIAKTPSGRRSTAAELLQEKYNVKARALAWLHMCISTFYLITVGWGLSTGRFPLILRLQSLLHLCNAGNPGV